MSVTLKRVYDPPAQEDGYRILVDRLWPRGLSKDAAHVDLWLQRIAPTTELREWYGHDVAKWDEFQARYREELSGHKELKARLLTEKEVSGLPRAMEIDREISKDFDALVVAAPDHWHTPAALLMVIDALTFFGAAATRCSRTTASDPKTIR